MYYDIKTLAPFLIKNDNLIRIGRSHDGGYLLSEKIIENTNLLISFGINADWSFEKDFKNKRDVTIQAFDFSVTQSSLIKKLFKYITRLRFKKVISQFNAILDFKVFFNEKNRNYFHLKGVGNNPDFLTFNQVMDLAGRKLDDSNRNIFVKIDIEGSEFDVIPSIKPYFNQIVGMAVEFHELDENSPSFNNLISLLKNDFNILHVHGNNNNKTINGTNLPIVLEITFFNKKLVQETDVYQSLENYPLKGLDYPNTKGKKEISLSFK